MGLTLEPMPHKILTVLERNSMTMSSTSIHGNNIGTIIGSLSSVPTNISIALHNIDGSPNGINDETDAY